MCILYYLRVVGSQNWKTGREILHRSTNAPKGYVGKYIIGTPFFISRLLPPTASAIDDNCFGSHKGMDEKRQLKDEEKPSDFTYYLEVLLSKTSGSRTRSTGYYSLFYILD